MMFDIAAKRLAWIPVRWPGIVQDGDGLAKNVEHEIELQVEIVSGERLREIFPRDDDKSDLTEIEKFQAVVQDWRRVTNGGASVPMTPDNIAKLLAVPMFKVGFERCYLDAWTGQIETRLGNSDASPASGPAGGAADAAKR